MPYREFLRQQFWLIDFSFVDDNLLDLIAEVDVNDEEGCFLLGRVTRQLAVLVNRVVNLATTVVVIQTLRFRIFAARLEVVIPSLEVFIFCLALFPTLHHSEH